MFCPKCGAQLNEGVKFCSKCGTSMAGDQSQPQQSNIQPQYNQQAAQGTAKLSPWGYFISALKKYVVFNGRARRAEFWWFALFYFIFQLIITILVGSLIANVAMLALLLPCISVYVRRMHDCGKPGAFFLIPIYGWIVLPLTAGTVGANQYGPDPKQVN